MRTIKTYRKVGAFYIAWEEDLSTPIRLGPTSAQVLTAIYCSFAYSAFSFLQDGDVAVGVFPQREKVFVGDQRPNTLVTFKM
jgi:hypothetical protein